MLLRLPMQEGKIDKRHGDPDDPEGRNSGQKAVSSAAAFRFGGAVLHCMVQRAQACTCSEPRA